MKVKLLGTRKLDFKTDDGSIVKGTQLFISYADEGVLGEMAEKKFLPDGFDLPTLNPGEWLDLDCNTKGKVLGIRAIPAPTPASAFGK